MASPIQSGRTSPVQNGPWTTCLKGAERQVRAKASSGPVLIVGYSSRARRSAGALRMVSSGRAGRSRFSVRSTGGLPPLTNPVDDGCGGPFATSRAISCAATSRAVAAFISSRFSRLLQRAAGSDLPKMAGRWARRGRLPRLLSRNPVFETELNMRLLIRAAVPWTQRIESELPPLDCPSLFVRGSDDEAFDGLWRSLCPRLDIKAVTGSHVAILEPPHFSGGRWPDQGARPEKAAIGDGSGRGRLTSEHPSRSGFSLTSIWRLSADGRPQSESARNPQAPHSMAANDAALQQLDLRRVARIQFRRWKSVPRFSNG